jgi:spore germination protein GerM
MKSANQKVSMTYNYLILNIIGMICMLVCAVPCLSAPIEPDGIDPFNTDNGIMSADASGDFPVYLYFSDAKQKFLIGEERSKIASEDAIAFCSRLVEELIRGPLSGLSATVPPETILRAVYITKDKTAYVDLSKKIMTGHTGGIVSEQMTIYSIVNTLILNISTVDQVKILIEGQEAETLAGHIDIRFPLSADMLLIR